APASAGVTLAVNASGVYWSANGGGGGSQAGIMMVPLGGGAMTTVVQNAQSCGNSASFAVDDSAVYYWSSGFGGGGPGLPQSVGGLTRVALSDGTQTTLAPTPMGANGLCGAVAVDASRVYTLGINQSGGSQTVITLAQVSLAGGPLTTLATEQGMGGAGPIAVSQDRAVFQTLSPNGSGNGGPGSFEVVPGGGGSTTTVPMINNNQGGIGTFTADATNIYVIGSSCPCGPNSGSGEPTGAVVKLPIDGSPGTVLAQVTGVADDIAVDSTDVYFATDSVVWKVPISGGEARAVAGNLTGGGPIPPGCSGSCGPPLSSVIAITLDAASVYIADTNTAVNSILKVAK
ncbi:MAG: hypothetical protein ACREJ3_04665, partial [Polyangiaceae bacterium]